MGASAKHFAIAPSLSLPRFAGEGTLYLSVARKGLPA
jgi:hypothetical protein